MGNGKLGRCLVIANSAENLMTYHELLARQFTTQSSSTFDSTFDIIDDFDPEVIIIDEKIIDSSAIEIANSIRNDNITHNYFSIIVIASDECKDTSQLQELTRADFVLESMQVPTMLIKYCLHCLRIKRLEDAISGLKSKLAVTQGVVRELESQDSITRLYNLPYINILLEAEFQRSHRFDIPLTILLVSIDEFIEISHREGPKICIKIIQQLGSDLKSLLRTGDLLGRSWGGEFLCILPETDGHGSLVLARRIKDYVAERYYGLDSQRHKITISQGLGYFHPRKSNLSNIHDLLIEAEKNLSMAKGSGKNQIVLRNQIAS